jgi:hypothetical protein
VDTINLGFLLRENLLLYSSYLPLGVPNGTVIYINTAATSNKFSGAVAGEKEDFCKGSFARTSFTLFIVLLLIYFYLHRFIKNTKNLVSFIVVTLLLLVHYVVP